MAHDHKWKEISDLPEDFRTLTNDELRPLLRVWQEQKSSLNVGGALDEFNTRLKREWAIETGSIEGVYTVDRGTTEMLIQHGINPSLVPRQHDDQSQEQVAAIMLDQADVLEGLFDFVKGGRQLTVGYIKEVHGALLQHQDTFTVSTPDGKLFRKKLTKGDYKKMPNNPRREDGAFYEYCPPEHVASEMDRLVRMAAEHEAKGVPPEVEAAWLHHRFTQIHPFEDGNGRVARALASLVLIRSDWFPLIVRNDEKPTYIAALEAADDGNLGLLVEQFAGIQRRIVLTAINLSLEVHPPASIDEAVAYTRDILVGRGQVIPPEWERARSVIADALFEMTVARLDYARARLSEQITSARAGLQFGRNLGHYQQETAAIANMLGYTANLSASFKSADLRIVSNNSEIAGLVFSFHGIGQRYRGVVVVSAFLATPHLEPRPIRNEVFQINYAEDVEAAKLRFGKWLEETIVRGLSAWQQLLE